MYPWGRGDNDQQLTGERCWTTTQALARSCNARWTTNVGALSNQAAVPAAPQTMISHTQVIWLQATVTSTLQYSRNTKTWRLLKAANKVPLYWVVLIRLSKSMALSCNLKMLSEVAEVKLTGSLFHHLELRLKKLLSQWQLLNLYNGLIL